MARSVAIAIGVAAPNHLTPLPGVRTGVKEFIIWAQDQQFEVVDIVDFKGTPVTATDVYVNTTQAIRTRDVQRLFVFFAGHGVTLGQGRDFWLLSDAVDNPNEAINVPLSVQHARRAGIQHVAFFADACRSPAGKNELDLSGQSMFPAMRVDGQSHIDQFYATRSGDPSVEKVPEMDSRKAFGVFTRCLMRGLRGEEPQAVSKVTGGLHSRAVLSVSLRDYLEESVPLLASAEADVLQMPECTPVSSWTPNVLAWVVGAAPSEDDSERDALEATEHDLPTHERFGPSGRPFPSSPPRSLNKRIREHQNLQLNRIASGYAPSPPPSRFRGRTGLVVVGSEIDTGELTPSGLLTTRRDGVLFVECDPSLGSILLPLKGGTRTDRFWAGVGSFPDHIGTVSASARGVAHVEYQPTIASDIDPESRRDLLSTSGAKAQLSILHDSTDSMLFSRVLYEELNPTLAVLAAYHFNQNGRKDQLRNLLARYIARSHTIPFDVLMLAALDDVVDSFGTSMSRQLQFARPQFPMMTAGWALLEALEHYPADNLIEARKFLTPSPWTTFSASLPTVLLEALSPLPTNSRRKR